MLLFLLFLAAILYSIYHAFIGRRKGLPPGPMPLPFIGNVHQLDSAAPHRSIFDWSQTYGPLVTLWMPSPMIFVCDFDLMQELFVRQADNFSGRPPGFLTETISGYQGIIFSTGAYWKEQRRFAMNVLRELGFGRPVLERKITFEAHELVQLLRESFLDRPVDISEPLNSCVSNIMLSVLFGRRFEFDHPTPKRLRITNDKTNELFQSPGVILIDQYPWLRKLPIDLKFEELIESRAEFAKIVQSFIDEGKAKFVPDETADDFQTAYLQEMHRRANSGDGDLGTFTEESLLYSLVDFTDAGTETTIVTLRWAVLYLIRYPEVQDKLRNEIDSVLGSETDATMADRTRMPYTAATVMELQRSVNLLPINLVHSIVSDTVVRGYHLKAGTVIIPQIAALMMDPKIFTEPDNFNPGRFLNADGSLKKSDELMPFSLGKRACPGESLARMELFIILVTLIQKFEFAPNPDAPLPTLDAIEGFVRRPTPYQCIVKARK